MQDLFLLIKRVWRWHGGLAGSIAALQLWDPNLGLIWCPQCSLVFYYLVKTHRQISNSEMPLCVNKCGYECEIKWHLVQGFFLADSGFTSDVTIYQVKFF